MRVLVLGGTGMLGCSLVPVLSRYGHEVLTHGRTGEWKVDFNDDFSARGLLERAKPDAIVNLIALANVEMCEEYPELAYQGNVKPCELIKEYKDSVPDCRIIHVSTDHVYSGFEPSSELLASPCNVYASTKLEGENVLKDCALVLRTNFFGPSQHLSKLSFSDWLSDGFRCGRVMKLFTDVFFSPLRMVTLSELVEKFLKNDFCGVFNMGSHEGMSKKDFGLEIAHWGGWSPENILEVRYCEMPNMIKRPLDMRMDLSKFEMKFKISLPSLREEIQSL